MPRSSSLKLPILVLATSLFVVTSSEFQVSAMLTAMSRDLEVPVGDLGLLVTTYSLGMGLGGPAIALALRRQPPRRGLVLVMLGYAFTEGLAGAMDDHFALLLLRFLSGALSGATFGMALSAGMGLGTEANQSRVSSGVLAGLMAGTLLGLPLSNLLAETVGWRASFYCLAAAAALMALTVHWVLPAPTTAAREEAETLGVLRNRDLWIRYLTSFLVIGGSFAAFAFIDPLLRRAGLTSGQVTLTMLAFGAAAFTMNFVTGRVAPGSARRALTWGLIAQLAALAIFLAAPTRAAPVLAATIMLGATGIALNPLLVGRVLTVARPGVLVNTAHTSAITLGIAAATTISSRAIRGTGSLDGALITGLALTGAALLSMRLAAERRQGS